MPQPSGRSVGSRYCPSENKISFVNMKANRQHLIKDFRSCPPCGCGVIFCPACAWDQGNLHFCNAVNHWLRRLQWLMAFAISPVCWQQLDTDLIWSCQFIMRRIYSLYACEHTLYTTQRFSYRESTPSSAPPFAEDCGGVNLVKHWWSCVIFTRLPTVCFHDIGLKQEPWQQNANPRPWILINAILLA